MSMSSIWRKIVGSTKVAFWMHFSNIHLPVETMSFRESLNTIQIREMFSKFRSKTSHGLLRLLNGFTHGQNWTQIQLRP